LNESVRGSIPLTGSKLKIEVTRMGNRTRVPVEQTETRALINAVLNYLQLRHGAIVEVIVKDWVAEKDERLEGLRKEREETKND
jgi:hypothetical protein